MHTAERTSVELADQADLSLEQCRDCEDAGQ